MGRVPQSVRALFDAILVMEKLTKSEICNNRLRQIHLVDIDNLTGGPTKDPFIHRQVREWYDFHSDRQERDLCFVAASHYSAFSATKAWAGAKMIWASGVDGADLALIRIVEETSFLNIRRVCLGSGDWIFKFAFSPFLKMDVNLAICCREDSFSKSLHRFTDDVTFLSPISGDNFVVSPPKNVSLAFN